MPIRAAGMLATATLNHKLQVCFFSVRLLEGAKGLSFLKNVTTTARMAPS